jgi:aspartyl-tRNA(Asn)/glutamyl-tRNA(Gln) amidotransferase subunit B
MRDGKDKLVGFFVGQAMKATHGTADPGRIGELVRERLAAG